MSIPLISGLGFTEVSSAGNLNDKAGTAKSKLPIQFFRLSDNITGNLTLNNDSAHKKIILDTNGKTITNENGAPLTTNSSTTLELKGSGNIQSTLKTFTASESSTSHTGTTVLSNSDSSTLVVALADRAADISVSGGVSVASGFQGSMSGADPFHFPNTELLTLPSNPGGNTGSLSGGATAATQQLFTIVGGASFPNLQSGAGFSVNVDGTVRTAPTATTSGEFASVSFGALTFQFFGSSRVRAFGGSSISAMQIPNNIVSDGGRTIAFTNNLAISVVLTGADPYDGVTVAAGATNTVTTTTTDGSFSLTGTISGSDGSSQPFALVPPNDGTGSINTDAYTGTLSASAL